jgi:dipeptidase E
LAERHILAMSSGFLGGAETEPLDELVLELTGKARLRICLLPTASGDDPRHTLTFYERFGPRASASHLQLFAREIVDVRGFLLDQDAIYVRGGNVASMLAVWRAHGIDDVLREAWELGIVLAGASAGCICWFSAGVTGSFGDWGALSDGLAFLEGSSCVHADEPLRRLYRQFVADGLPEGYAVEDGAALHFVGAELAEAVSASAGASCFRVGPDGETRLPMTSVAR